MAEREREREKVNKPSPYCGAKNWIKGSRLKIVLSFLDQTKHCIFVSYPQHRDYDTSRSVSPRLSFSDTILLGINSQLSRFTTAMGSCTGLVTIGPTKV